MKNQHFNLLIPLLVSFLFLSLCCKDEPTKPDDILKEGPRYYTWTVDTLAYPGSWQTNMQSIWGSSASDVYIVGHNDQMGSGNMFRFDGEKWTAIKFHSADGGTIYGSISLTDVYGFTSNDIWAVGSKYEYNYTMDSSFIMHYNGIQWTEQQIQRGRSLQVVWGLGPNDVWAGGISGILYHYNGVQWSKVPLTSNEWFARIEGISSNDVYGIAYHFTTANDTMVWSLMHWDGASWSIQIQFNNDYYVADKFGTGALHVINGTYYSVGRGYFRKAGTNWERIYYNDNRPSFIDFAALNENDVVVVGSRGLVYHYNGSDWYQFAQFNNPNFSYCDCWRSDKEVFIVGHDGNKTIILHGK